MELYLIVAKGKQEGTPIRIKVDLFLMGSDKVCQLRSSLPGMAPQHCAVVMRDKKVFVRDLGGGTYVNRELVPARTEWPLHKGDRLTVGPLEFVVQFHEKQLAQGEAKDWALRALNSEAGKDLQQWEDDEEEEAPLAPPTSTASAAAAAILGQLQLRKGIVRGRLRLSVRGEITMIRFNEPYLVEPAEIALIKKELLDSMKRPRQRILLDFKHLRRMSSNAVEMIQDVCRHVRDHAGSVAFCRVRGEIRSVMDTLGVFQSMRYFDDKETALKATW